MGEQATFSPFQVQGDCPRLLDAELKTLSHSPPHVSQALGRSARHFISSGLSSPLLPLKHLDKARPKQLLAFSKLRNKINCLKLPQVILWQVHEPVHSGGTD